MRDAVAALCEVGVSERRACLKIGIPTASKRHKSKRKDDSVIRTRIVELANIRRRFGYRRITNLFQREGKEVNHKRVYRIYSEEILQVFERKLVLKY